MHALQLPLPLTIIRKKICSMTYVYNDVNVKITKRAVHNLLYWPNPTSNLFVVTII